MKGLSQSSPVQSRPLWVTMTVSEMVCSLLRAGNCHDLVDPCPLTILAPYASHGVHAIRKAPHASYRVSVAAVVWQNDGLYNSDRLAQPAEPCVARISSRNDDRLTG